MTKQVRTECRLIGHHDGIAWGETIASRGQLLRLWRFFERPDFESWFSEVWLDGLRQNGHCPQHTLASIVEPRRSTSRLLGSFIKVSMDSREGQIDNVIDTGEYLQGFVEGALSVA